MDYNELVKEFTIFHNIDDVTNWIRSAGKSLSNVATIIRSGNGYILDSVKVRYSKRLVSLKIEDNDIPNCDLNSSCPTASDRDYWTNIGVGAGVGFATAALFSGPAGWFTLAGAALGLGTSHNKNISNAKVLLLENAKIAANFYADRLISSCDRKKTIKAMGRLPAPVSNLKYTPNGARGAIDNIISTNSGKSNTTINTPPDTVATHEEKTTTNIRVHHKISGKGIIRSINSDKMIVDYDNCSDVMRFPDAFTNSIFTDNFDIDDDFDNSTLAISYLEDHNLIDRFEDKSVDSNSRKKISWMYECVNRYRLLKKLEEYGFEGFLHTTHFENFVYIYHCKRMRSRGHLQDSKTPFKDCAHAEIISKTSQDIKYHNRFYYRCKTPTNYSAFHFHDQTRPVIFMLAPNCIYHKNTLFYDGNARAFNSTCTTKASEAINFNWDCIFSPPRSFPAGHEDVEIAAYGCTQKELKRMQNAEFLLFGDIDVKYFKHIYFMDAGDYAVATKLFGYSEKFACNSNLFPTRSLL